MLRIYNHIFLKSVSGLILSLCVFTLSAQRWDRAIGNIGSESGHDIAVSADGGFAVAGFRQETTGTARDIFILRLNAEGDTLWTATIGASGTDEEANAIIWLPDGRWAICGYTKSYNAPGKDAFLAFLDPSGRTTGLYQSGSSMYDEFNDLIFDPVQHQIILTGYTLTATDGYAAYFAGYDLSGNLIWENTTGGVQHEVSQALTAGPNNTFFAAGMSFSGTDEQDIYLACLHSDGALLWEQYYTTPEKDQAKDLLFMPSGELVLLGSREVAENNTDFYILKTDGAGNYVWSITFDGEASEQGEAIALSATGGLMLAGTSSGIVDGAGDMLLIETDAFGNELWRNTYGGTQAEAAIGLANLDDGYILAGFTASFGNGNKDCYVVRTNLQGQTLTNHISGLVYADETGNCSLDASEMPLKGWMIRAQGGQDYYYALSDDQGRFDIVVPAGDYTVSLVPPDGYWSVCDESNIVLLSQPYQSISLYLGATQQSLCPDIRTDISTPWLSPCHKAVYNIRYENIGTDMAPNSYLKVQLDQHLSYVTATLPAQLVLNTLTIPLGDLPPGAVGYLDIETILNCTAIPGETHPVTVRAFPNTVCNPLPNGWNGAEIRTAITALTDSIHFEIRNAGTAPTETPIDYIVIEDELIYLSGSVSLAPGAAYPVSVPANGSTWRIQAEQVPGFPGKSAPCAAIEAYAAQPGMPFNLGHIDQFPADDADFNIATDYQENAASFGMHDLRGYPTGYGEPHYIAPETAIDYLIRFHYAASDTLDFLEIRDSLPSNLDLLSLTPGASSHPYRMVISPSGVVSFFIDQPGISGYNTDPDASHGFVKFRISPLPDLPTGTVLQNRAMIAYNGGAFYYTNTTIHTIKPIGILINGLIETEEGLPVGNVTVNAGIPPAQLVQYTDASGAFQFPILAADADYKIVPYRNDFHLNGVTTYDLLLIKKHILGISPLSSPYRLIAADANKSGAISAGDLVEIRKLILGLTDTFTNNTSWRFVPANFIFPDEDNPFVNTIPSDYEAFDQADNLNVNFTGIKTGDVNATAQPQLDDMPVNRNASFPSYFLKVTGVEEAPGIWKFSFYPDAFTSMGLEGFQWTLHFDKNQLKFVDLETATANITDQHLGFRLLSEGIITVSWETVKPVYADDRSPLFHLRFKSLQPVEKTPVLRAGSFVTSSEAYLTGSEGPFTADLFLRQEDGAPAASLVPIAYPNPSDRGAVTIEWETIRTGTGYIRLKDLHGREILSLLKTDVLPAGRHQLVINSEEIPAGVCIVEIQSDGLTTLIRLVRL